MSMLPPAKIWCAALVISAGAWFPVAYHLPAAVSVGSLVCCLIVAALVLDRDRPLRNWTAGRALIREKAEGRHVRVLIIGAGAVGRELARRLEAGGTYRVVGFVDDEISPDETGRWPVLGGRDAASALV